MNSVPFRGAVENVRFVSLMRVGSRVDSKLESGEASFVAAPTDRRADLALQTLPVNTNADRIIIVFKRIPRMYDDIDERRSVSCTMATMSYLFIHQPFNSRPQRTQIELTPRRTLNPPDFTRCRQP